MVRRYSVIIVLSLLSTSAFGISKKYTKSPIPLGMDDLSCMALNLYFESRGEVKKTYIAAIGFVTLERVKSRNYPNSVCKVIYEQRYSKKMNKWIPMYSWTLDNLSDIPENLEAYRRCHEIAKEIFKNRIKNVTKNATHYHSVTVTPVWSNSMIVTIQLGRHIFYR